MKPTHGEFRPGAPTPTTEIAVEHCDGDGGGSTTHEINMEKYGEAFTPCKFYVESGPLPEPDEDDY